MGYSFGPVHYDREALRVAFRSIANNITSDREKVFFHMLATMSDSTEKEKVIARRRIPKLVDALKAKKLMTGKMIDDYNKFITEVLCV